MRYRGASHIHSAFSYDGRLDLPRLKECLKTAGFSFACLTEHAEQGFDKRKMEELAKSCREASDGSFVFVPGLELAFPRAHVLALGVEQGTDPEEEPAALLKKLKQAGCFVVFAHPHRSGFIAPEGTEGSLDAVEVWNLQYDGKRVPRTRSLAYLEQLREKHPGTKASAGLDFHRETHAGGPGIELELERLETEEIVQALKDGRYELVNGEVRVMPDGEVRGMPAGKRRRVSALSIMAIQFAKTASSWAKKLHLKPPKRLAAKLRKMM